MIGSLYPIGTICRIKNNPNDLMIVGYLQDSGEYKACLYPKGFTGVYETILFDPKHMEEVKFEGYKSSEFESYVRIMTKAAEVAAKGPNFVFDENGVVVLDNTVPKPAEELELPKAKTEEQAVVFETTITTDNIKVNDSEKIINRFEFDENGVIIADNSELLEKESLDYKFDENGIIIEDNTMPASNLFEFDASGVVIKDNAVEETLAVDDPNIKSSFVFDADGVIIADNTVD